MRDLSILLVHLIATIFWLAHPVGLRSVVAESVLIKHQLLIVNRSRRRAPNLRALDRLIAGLCSLWINDPQETRKGRAEVSPHRPEFSTGIRNTPDNKAGRATPSPPQIRVAGWTVSGSLRVRFAAWDFFKSQAGDRTYD